jgi:hypothetical protein
MTTLLSRIVRSRAAGVVIDELKTGRVEQDLSTSCELAALEKARLIVRTSDGRLLGTVRGFDEESRRRA